MSMDDQKRAAKRDHLIRTAEWVLAKAYRNCTKKELLESQLRVRESVIREMRRRIRH